MHVHLPPGGWPSEDNKSGVHRVRQSVWSPYSINLNKLSALGVQLLITRWMYSFLLQAIVVNAWKLITSLLAGHHWMAERHIWLGPNINLLIHINDLQTTLPCIYIHWYVTVLEVLQAVKWRLRSTWLPNRLLIIIWTQKPWKLKKFSGLRPSPLMMFGTQQRAAITRPWTSFQLTSLVCAINPFPYGLTWLSTTFSSGEN